MDLSMSFNNIEIYIYFPLMFFGWLFAFTGLIGSLLSIILYITFPKKIKEEFFETSPDKTVRWGYDSYLAYYMFPWMVSMVTVIGPYKKVFSHHYDFKEKLSKRRLSFFRFHFFIVATGLVSFLLTMLFIVIAEVLEYFNLIQAI
jgi:hypothetical protein